MQAHLVEIQATIADSEFADQSTEQLRTEVEKLDAIIRPLDSKIHACLDKLRIDPIDSPFKSK